MNEKKFLEYLDGIVQDNGEKYAEETKKRYIRRLKNISKLTYNYITEDIFSINDDKKISEIINNVNIKDELYGRKIYSLHKGLNHYLDFLKKINRIGEEVNLMKIKNIILYGVAGVGKTHNINQLIELIESGESEKKIFEIIEKNEKKENVDISNIKERIKFITFHQSFGYEDFIEGFRPNEEGQIKLVDGIFKEICKEAIDNGEANYYLVIDEINRGNISKIFGELITLIEEDKRDNLEVILPYSKEIFKIPSNLYIIGTMNSTDKSIALIDIALRRRFTFLKIKPNSNLVKNFKAKEIFEKLNEYIVKSLGEDYQIGHSYFINIDSDNDLEFILRYKIEPLLEEYFYGDDRLKEVKKIYGENL